jgi:hypothetical protein
VSDIVEMLEQWELANFKPEYQFVGPGGSPDTILVWVRNPPRPLNYVLEYKSGPF